MTKKRRIRLGILFYHNDNWIGGSYYILNLINSLNTISDNSKPEISILSDRESDYEFLKQTNYPYLKFLSLNHEDEYNVYQRFIFRFFQSYCIKKFKTQFSKKHIDVIFPYVDIFKLKKVKKKIYWCPDFQDYHYPEFFSPEELNSRRKLHDEVSKKNVTLILSSQSAKEDFIRFYPNHRCSPVVVPFAVTHPKYDIQDINVLLNKFGITSPYFISPNQFWTHKNHITILKAVNLLKKEGFEIKVVFTGKEFDYRAPSYTDQLKEYVKENNLSNNILFLGFIDRDEQLKLMSNAVAVIQPSLFEGWSTVIEDAKAMNQYVIASDIPVHREQLDSNVVFFEKNNYEELAGLLKLIKNKPGVIIKNYSENIKKYASKFLFVISK
jgi:glycosyltransferase involved in cell wall biosynthesis